MSYGFRKLELVGDFDILPLTVIFYFEDFELR
jgi:hypothetical protein